MIERYIYTEINKIWDDKNKYGIWLDLEKKIAKSWIKLLKIDQKQINSLDKLKLNLTRMREIESKTKHDVVAFTRMLSEQIGNESRWIHLGITSSDIVDTAQNIMIKQSNVIVEKLINQMIQLLKELSFKYENQLIMGRTHGVYGEPTSLGLKFALWYEEFKRQLVRFNAARKNIEVAKVSGSMGNYANLELEIEQDIAKHYGLKIDNLSTQVSQRDRHLELILTFSNIATSLEKIATEIRLFSRSEVQELNEGFAQGQKGSSSMPHKKNPISSENICGLARMIKSYSLVGLENNNLWHERDISHSSNERIMFCDLYNLVCYTLSRLHNTLKNLYVNVDKINQHIKQAKNIFFSQALMTKIIIYNQNVNREQIYDYIQTLSLKSLSENLDFYELVKNSDYQRYLTKKQLNEIFNLNYFLRQTKKIFNRVFKE